MFTDDVPVSLLESVINSQPEVRLRKTQRVGNKQPNNREYARCCSSHYRMSNREASGGQWSCPAPVALSAQSEADAVVGEPANGGDVVLLVCELLGEQVEVHGGCNNGAARLHPVGPPSMTLKKMYDCSMSYFSLLRPSMIRQS